jgi:hypothetical protein
MAENSNNEGLIKWVVIGAVALIAANKLFGAVSGLASGLLQKFGLSADPAVKKAAEDIAKFYAAQQAKGAGSYWSPAYWKAKSPNTKLIYDPNINAYVYSLTRKIYDGIGYTYDTPQQIIDAFKAINSKLGVSVVTSDFSYMYNQDLFSFLVSKLDTDEQVKFLLSIIQYTEGLPDIISGQ